MAKAQKTPIIKARNIGPVTASILPLLGIETLEDLRKLGWEEAAMRVLSEHPRFIHLNMLRALIGAFYGRDFRDIPAKDLEMAKKMVALFRQ